MKPQPVDGAELAGDALARSVLDASADPQLQVLARRIAEQLAVPIAVLVTLDADRRWTQSAMGVPADSTLPSDLALSALSILSLEGGITIVPDAQQDARFLTHPAVLGEPGIRFLALAPLTDTNGTALGAVCVLDVEPRCFDVIACERLAFLAEIVSSRLVFQRLNVALHESEDHHRHAVDLNAQIPWIADASGRVEEVGPRWPAAASGKPGVNTGRGWTKAIHREDVYGTLTKWARSVRSGQPFDVEYRLWTGDGNWRWFRSRAAPRLDAQGRVVRWYGSVEDIHERKLADRSRRESEQRLRFALEVGGLGAWEVDLATHRLTCSDLCAVNFGLTRAQQLSSYDVLVAAIHPDDRDRCGLEVQAVLQTGREMDIEFRNFWPDGTMHWMRVTGRVVYKRLGLPSSLVGLSLDISARRLAEEQRERAEAALIHLANHDALTGLANRRLLDSTMTGAVAAATARSRVALLCIDLDQFKAVNDKCGHAAGDKLLQQAAERLRGRAGPGATVARLGGDEFAILQPGIGKSFDVDAMARSLLHAVEQPYHLDECTMVVGCSIGVALAPDDAKSPEHLRRNADKALYRAKTAGRGQHRCFEPQKDTHEQGREALLLSMADALVGNQLSMSYQPLVDLATGRADGFEALMRWNHPKRGVIQPDDFIPLAEEVGWIARFGRWALVQACREAASWPRPAAVAVNLSAAQFNSGDLVTDVKDVLAETGLAAERLELEVTETLLLKASPQNCSVLAALRSLGVRIVMDDFGTGYSSLSYLRQFRFDKIKIDRSLISGVPDNDGGDTIVEAILGLGRSLGIAVTVEGVETPVQLAFLAAQGCRQAQGFLFSRPVAAAKIPRQLKRVWPR